MSKILEFYDREPKHMKIPLIKEIRSLTGLGLIPAKTICDEIHEYYNTQMLPWK